MSTEITRIVDHVDQGLARLTSQYRDKPLVRAWTASYLKQVQVLEHAIFDVLLGKTIDKAVGVQLDVIGRIVGEPRRGRDDATYKKFLFARIRINKSQGRLSDLLAVLSMISSDAARAAEHLTAAMVIELLAIPVEDPVAIYRLLADTKAGGVKLRFIVPTTDFAHAAAPRSWNEASVATHSVGDANQTQTPAALTMTSAGPFALVNGAQFQFTVNGVAVFQTFRTADFASIGAATPTEIANVMNRDHGSTWLVGLVGGDIEISTRKIGPGATIAIVGAIGMTNPFGFSSSSATGGGSIPVNGLISDSVTIRDPLAAPPAPRPGPPKIFSVTPSAGYVSGGTDITILGENFNDLVSVRVSEDAGDVSNVTNLVRVSSQEITATTGPHVVGKSFAAAVRVRSVRGDGLARAPFVYEPDPFFHITGVSPNYGPPGTTIVITGQLLAGVQAVDLFLELNGSINYVPTTFTVNSETQITAVVGEGGYLYIPYSIRVQAENGDYAVLGHSYFFRPAPTIRLDGIFPNHGSVAGIHGAIIVGSRFDIVTDIEAAGICSLEYDVQDSEHLINVYVPGCNPPDHSGTGQSAGETFVIFPYVGGASIDAGDLFFTYDPFVITSVSTSFTSTAGGETIFLNGTSLDGAYRRDFDMDGHTSPAMVMQTYDTGGTLISSDVLTFTIISDTQLSFVAPAHAAGDVIIHVTCVDDISFADVTLTYV